MVHDDDAERRASEQLRKRRKARLADRDVLDDGERERLRLQHWMRCPKCGCELDELTFRGVKVDKCLACGGVFLDDGELEQLAGKPGWLEAMRNFFSRSR